MIDQVFLTEVSNKKTYNLYVCDVAFFAYDERHTSIKKDEMFLGLSEGYAHRDWVFGCSDNNLSEFGFVPFQYLTLVKKIQRD